MDEWPLWHLGTPCESLHYWTHSACFWTEGGLHTADGAPPAQASSLKAVAVADGAAARRLRAPQPLVGRS
jgi:hypothetical protein